MKLENSVQNSWEIFFSTAVLLCDDLLKYEAQANDPDIDLRRRTLEIKQGLDRVSLSADHFVREEDGGACSQARMQKYFFPCV